MDGTFTRMLHALQADADAAADLDWLVAVDSTVVRAHQHAAGAKKGGQIQTSRQITPSADPVVD
ncbi:hypothetical protein GCM10023193_50540 [Planotetraspora kaengkrachanensis]|uniref:Transposase n=1 Tax=Planotetraspora kaengkrachanensis TaxID=575193 RepID=A0A8J3PSZ7_9ACTN|nr:hypothetical protein Pka01_27500 [Planotetraspora kaengkrachanensis]